MICKSNLYARWKFLKFCCTYLVMAVGRLMYSRNVNSYLKLGGQVVMRRVPAARQHILFCLNLGGQFTVGGIASICFRFHFQQTLRMHTQGCQKTRNVVRNSKILIARSTIQPKLSKIENHLPFFL